MMLEILRMSKLPQTASCLLCAILTRIYADPFDGTEAMGGSVTGPVLELFDIGWLLFVVSVPLVFESRRISGAVTVLASVLCFPLYLYVLAPGPFRWIFRGEYKGFIEADFVWEKWSIIGVLALATAAALGFRNLTRAIKNNPTKG
jgi:hypothetical protein